MSLAVVYSSCMTKTIYAQSINEFLPLSSSVSLYANFKFKPRCFLCIFSSFLEESKSRNVLTLTSGLKKKNELLITNFVYCMETKNKLEKELLGSLMMFAAAYDWKRLDVSEWLILSSSKAALLENVVDGIVMELKIPTVI